MFDRFHCDKYKVFFIKISVPVSFNGKEIHVEYAQSNTTILLCLTARNLHVTPNHSKNTTGMTYIRTRFLSFTYMVYGNASVLFFREGKPGSRR